ncbi:MAG TPA: T9SS type A sorting domain-containing protein, partial [Ferruginibacter sp.]|nr:T9SS type A sorting domain-containing protein [Ferruginibacter sp.]
FTVAANSILNAGTNNITVGTDDGNVGNNASFNLNANATLITANTGVAPNTAIEGTAIDGTTGTILAGTKISKTYNAGANYVLNGATVNPFPAAIGTMANLTIGAPVSLNKAIIATGTLDLASHTFTQAGNNLQFSGLASTTGNIYADNGSSLTISGTVGTVGPLRFATGGNTTGLFTLNRTVTVQLSSDLTIDNSALSGNLVTGTATSILDINGNTLTINGAVSGSGSISGSNTSSLALGGTAGTVSFTSGKRVLKNLSLVNNATATLGTTLDITEGASAGNEGTVSVTGTAVLTTGGNLTLKSGATGTARVAPGAITGAYINGDVTVERYLPAARAWRFLAAPTVGQTIKQSWQENQAAGVDPGTGYGTIITSNAGTWAANGFDFYSAGSSFLFHNGTAWQSVASTITPIALAGDNKSYMLFSRGNRSITPAMGTGAAPTPVILRTKGSLFQGNLPPITLAAPGAFAAVGNNYASAIDFTLLNRTNIDNSFSVWDPKIPGAQGLGGWVTFSASTPTPWVPVPGGGSYTAGVPNKRIESGQAFMVHTASGSANVTFTESSKLAASNLVSRPMGSLSAKSGITTNLYNMSTGAPNIADGNVVVFSSEYADAIDENDAIKSTNFGDNFGLLVNGLPFVVEARQPVSENDTIFYNMRKIKLQPYRLEIIAENFDNSITGFFEDRFLNTSTPINMTGTTTVDFSVSSDLASSAADRFRIVFKNLRPLPVTFTSITAVKNNNGNVVEWKVENELNIASYEIERSTDGINFTKVGAAAAGGSNYNWFDAYPVSGDNFYRIKSIGNRGAAGFSRIVKVGAVKGRTGYTVYPNPSTDGSFGLQMSNLSAGLYTVKITNGNGQLIWKQSVSHPGGTSTNIINPTSQLGSGNYQLEVIDITGKSTVIKVMVL